MIMNDLFPLYFCPTWLGTLVDLVVFGMATVSLVFVVFLLEGVRISGIDAPAIAAILLRRLAAVGASLPAGPLRNEGLAGLPESGNGRGHVVSPSAMGARSASRALVR